MSRGLVILASVLAVAALVAAIIGDTVVGNIAEDRMSNDAFEREHPTDPGDWGLDFKETTIPSDGLELSAWWIPAEDTNDRGNATVVLVHGHSATMSKVVERWGPNLHAEGYNLLALDLRNHGTSPDTASGRVTFGSGESHDVLAAVQWVRDHAAALGVDAGRIALYGASMGATTVLHAAGQPGVEVAAVLADSGFASFRFQALLEGHADGYPTFLIDGVLRQMDRLEPDTPPSEADAEVALERIHVPVFLAHCTDDERVDARSWDRLVAASDPARRTTWHEACPRASALSETHHVEGWMQPGYNATVNAFLATVL